MHEARPTVLGHSSRPSKCSSHSAGLTPVNARCVARKCSTSRIKNNRLRCICLLCLCLNHCPLVWRTNTDGACQKGSSKFSASLLKASALTRDGHLSRLAAGAWISQLLDQFERQRSPSPFISTKQDILPQPKQSPVGQSRSVRRWRYCRPSVGFPLATSAFHPFQFNSVAYTDLDSCAMTNAPTAQQTSENRSLTR